jgi:hypothetical protein
MNQIKNPLNKSNFTLFTNEFLPSIVMKPNFLPMLIRLRVKRKLWHISTAR